jgi:hypothetical protein
MSSERRLTVADHSPLERDLRLLGEQAVWPETPDLAPSVISRLSSAGPARRVLPHPLRPLVLAALALLVLAGTVMAASPSAREAVLDLFGLNGATVERRERLPAELPRGERPFLGERVSLAEARRAVSFRVLVPQELGFPDRVQVRREVPGGEVTLAFGTRPGLPPSGPSGLGALVSEFRGDLAPELIGKIAQEGTEVRRLRVEGAAGLWLRGAPHLVLVRDASGAVIERESRLAGNVLLFERGRLLVRVEADVSLRRALEIGRSLG